MRSGCPLLITILLGASAGPAGGQNPAPENLDFEKGAAGASPPGWFMPSAGYELKAVDEEPFEGKLCLRLSSAAENPAAPFGNVMQTVDATPYRGRTVRFRAAVRVMPAGAGDRAQLWLRVDRAGGRMGFFDNMGDRPIRDSRWRPYEIVGEVAPDATTLNFGLMLARFGRAYLDAAGLEIVAAPAQPAAEPPRPLAGRALENLVAFTRLLGYVRFFCPSDEAADADWDYLAVAGVRRVEDARDAADLAARLQEVFGPLAPAVRVYVTGRQPALPPEIKNPPDGDRPTFVYWRHLGVGLDETPRGPAGVSIYRSTRERCTVGDADPAAPGENSPPAPVPHPSQPCTAELGGSVSAVIPLALWLDAAGRTLPRAPPPASQPAEPPPLRAADRATRLAAVALAWNVFQHFYPYFEVVAEAWPAAPAWPAVLETALRSAATDADECAFLLTLQRMVAALHDGHGGVYRPMCEVQRNASLPLAWEWVEDQLVITAGAAATELQPSETDLRPGAVVRSIDGRSPAAALAEREQYISGATAGWIRQRALADLLRGAAGSSVCLEIARSGVDQQGAAPDEGVRSINLARVPMNQPVRPARPEKIAELQPGVVYVDLDRITDEDFAAAIPKLERARGLIFDLRGYPRCSVTPLAHLLDGPITCARWNVPIVTRPDRQAWDYQFSNWPVAPRQPRFTAKVAFLTGPNAISYAETYLGIVEHYRLAEIVGEQTAGTNGNVNPFTLPGGYSVAWTGMKVLKHDGSQHHAIGIRPSVPVRRTVAGIRAGRDEVLERAVEVVTAE